FPSIFFLIASAPPHSCTLSLHDALPISATCSSRARDANQHGVGAEGGLVECPSRVDSRRPRHAACSPALRPAYRDSPSVRRRLRDRKSTRLNSSHVEISYAVFCLKKKTE